MKRITCCVCDRWPKYRRKVSGIELKNYVERILDRKVDENEVICTACSIKYYKAKKTEKYQNNVNSAHKKTSSHTNSSQSTCHLRMKSVSYSHKYCIICKKKQNSRRSLIVLPKKAQTQAFIEGIYIPKKARLCRNHIKGKLIKDADLKTMPVNEGKKLYLTPEISSLIEEMRDHMKRTSYINFDTLPEEYYHNLTGLEKSQFDELCTYIEGRRNTCVRSIKTTVGILLTKLRTGLANKLLSVMFKLKVSQIQRAVHSARCALLSHFVPYNLGFSHITHDEFCEKHTTSTASTLFKSSQNANEAVIVLDGTYIYIQKSADYLFQRKSYSCHKNRPLVKPMMIVGSDGYILTVLGPYYANGNNNDANIMKHVFDVNDENISSWLRDDDIIIVDRGFRDAIKFLEDLGLTVHMPPYLSKGQKQHTVQEANLSRLITKVRWVVESSNGRIKHWKLLNDVMQNSLVPYIGDFTRIVCAIINKFRPPLVTDDEQSHRIAAEMKEKSVLGNQLQVYLEENEFVSKRVVYRSALEYDLAELPRLTLNELREVTFGVYQLKQAQNYTYEHYNENGDYIIECLKTNPKILKVSIQSRHTGTLKYATWIQFGSADEEEKIKGWYCKCKAGARVVGCCAHLASILWHISIERFEKKVKVSMNEKSKLKDAGSIKRKEE
ncbi:uncharacterized protein LOC128554692 [Mercenaria mercenaria]|uniref:uncharacterized protein LOC128554692 n=1 Tax=Mercenaria mercenaria TaxID=6596 RepID=UPI00234ECC01|nr:uncharacterized protein LOC128554692 [Mercenaria mercenaria]